VHGKHLQSLSLLRGIFGICYLLLAGICDYILGSNESCLCRLGLICASFCGRTKFLSTSAISGSSSLSWTSHANRGSGGKNVIFFQMAPILLLSVLIYSNRS
jgi:hypothetical protein